MAREEFADYLNHLLLDADRSASWLARRLRVAPSTVSRWLDGTTQPNSLMRVEAILDILKIRDEHIRCAILEAYRFWWEQRTFTVR
jgi:hypothetical protein